MGLVKLTFDGSIITAKQDATLNHFLTNNESGIYKNIGGEITGNITNSKIVFLDGYAQILGRRVYVEKDTEVPITLDSNKSGVIMISVDTENETAEIVKKEVPQGQQTPSPIRTATVEKDGIYELPIFYYTHTTYDIVKVNKNLEYIEQASKKLTSVMDEFKNQIQSSVDTLKSRVSYVESSVNSLSSRTNLSSEKVTNKNTHSQSFNFITQCYDWSVFDLPYGETERLVFIPINSMGTLTISYKYLLQARSVYVSCKDTMVEVSIKTLQYQHYTSGDNTIILSEPKSDVETRNMELRNPSIGYSITSSKFLCVDIKSNSVNTSNLCPEIWYIS